VLAIYLLNLWRFSYERAQEFVLPGLSAVKALAPVSPFAKGIGGSSLLAEQGTVFNLTAEGGGVICRIRLHGSI